MENLKDILSNLKERFTNPLIFSFLFSWIIINWRITIALLWYGAKDIDRAGSNDVFQFISKNLNIWTSFWDPLFFAIGYTLLIPIIRNLIRAFYSWAHRWGEDWNIEILGTSNVPMTKYLKFRADYETKTKQLQEVISKENEYVTQNQDLTNQLLKSQTNSNDILKELNDVRNFVFELKDMKILNGNWRNVWQDQKDKNLAGAEELIIENGVYYTYDTFGKRIPTFRIVNFFYDNKTKEVFFIKDRINQQEIYTPGKAKYYIDVLKVESGNIMTGIENDTTNITYRRIAANLVSKNESE